MARRKKNKPVEIAADAAVETSIAAVKWRVTRPNGTSMVTTNLERFKLAFGFDMDGLKNLGWKFENLTKEGDS